MICPNCGKSVSAEQELCPHCGKPTQFSSRMQYYPRSTPLDPADSKQAPLSLPQNSSTVTKLDPADRKQILGGIEKAANKETVLRIKRSMTFLVLSVGALLLLSVLLLGLLFLRSYRTKASAATADITDLYVKIDNLEKSVREMSNEMEASLSAKTTEITDSIGALATSDDVLVVLYCSGPNDNNSSPVCFTMRAGEQFLLPELYGKDQLFLGWSTERDGKSDIVKAGHSVAVNGSISFYAKWEPIVTSSPVPMITPSPTISSLTEEEQNNSIPTPTATARRWGW